MAEDRNILQKIISPTEEEKEKVEEDGKSSKSKSESHHKEE